MKRHLAIAIDGPAASGKSSVAKGVARELRFNMINSGAMYRAFTWHVLESGVDPEDKEAVLNLLARTQFNCGLRDRQSTIGVNGRVLGEELTRETVNQNVSVISTYPPVRERLVAEQRRYLDLGDLVMEGRDIGTVVFPDSPKKFFLHASEDVRQARREAQGLQDNVAARDKVDSSRAVAPLKVAEDAMVIDTSHLTLEEVIARIVARVKGQPVPFRHDRMNFMYWLGYKLTSALNYGVYHMEVFGRENAEFEGGCLIAANHTSFLDPPAVGNALHEPIYYMARKTLFKGIGGKIIPQLNAIPVDQENADLTTMRTVIRLVKEDGKKLLIFPEGQRSYDGNMMPGERGVGMLISKTRAPVLPVRIFGAHAIYPRSAKLPQWHGKLSIVIGKPIYFSEEALNAKGKTAYKDLADRVMAAIAKLQLPG